MPYYVGAGEPEWDEYLEGNDGGEPPVALFKYVEPWIAKTTVLRFSETPGPRPEGQSAGPAPQQASPEQLVERFEREQKALAELALWRISSAVAACRVAGIKRILGHYDGGGDESFAYCRGVEMSDGRVIAADSMNEEIGGIGCARLVEDAAFALLGAHDAGEFVLRGAVTIDLDAGTITDEKDADVVFAR